MNETVKLSFKIKALPNDNLEEGAEIKAGGGFHRSFDGAGWLSSAPVSTFKVGEWTTVEQTFEIANADITNYSIDLSQDAAAITYLIDEVSATWTEAPVLDWVDVIENGDLEAGYSGAADEHLFFFSKEVPVNGSTPGRARILDGVGVDGGKGIEVRAGAKEADPWDNQFWIREPYALPAGTSFKVEFDLKAEKEASTGTQSHLSTPGSYKHYACIGNPKFTTEWTHFTYEGKVADAADGFQSIAFNLNDFEGANIYYFDNVKFEVPANVVNEIEATWLDPADYPVVEYTDPTTLTYTDLLVEDFEGYADANTNFLSKLVLGHSEEEVDEDGEKTGNRITVIDDDDPEILPAVKSAVGSNWIADGEEVKLGSSALSLAVKQLPEGGTEYDSQFFIRLPKALPKDAVVNVEFDYWASQDVTVNTQAHNEPGQYVGNNGIGALKFVAKKWQHFQKYVKVSADMRTIAFNISAAGATYRLDNFKIQIADGFVAAADELTKTMDETSLWEAYELPLNEKINEAKNTDTEGYTEESVQALEDAIQAAKEALAPGEDDPATAESLSDAKAALEAAIAGLEKDEPDAIDGIAAGAAVKDGKYFINGQIVIVKGGKKYNAAGVEIK